MSFSSYSSNAILEGVAIDHSELWVQVHNGVPGPDGTANVSTASPTRVLAAFSVVDNILSNDAIVDLASDGTGAEQISYCSLWDAVSGGNCIYTNGALTPVTTFTAGDEVSFQAGSLTVKLQKPV